MSAARRKAGAAAPMLLLLLGSVVALAPGPAAAQGCVGLPSGSGGWSLRVLSGLTDHDGTHLGASVTKRLGERVVVGVGYARTGFEGGGPERYEGNVGVAFEAAPELRKLWTGVAEAVSLCPTAEVRVSDMGELSVTAVRLGSAVGYAVEPGGSGWGLYPFASPLLVYRRASFGGLTDTQWDGGVRGGVSAARGRFLVSLELERVWSASREDRAVLSVGVLF